jgi:hypothetical protein
MRRSAIHPTSRRRRAVGELALSAGALLLLLGVLASMDDRVRNLVSLHDGTPRPAAEVVAAGGQARDIAVLVLDAVRTQAADHAPLAIFALAATVLVVVMLRT